MLLSTFVEHSSILSESNSEWILDMIRLNHIVQGQRPTSAFSADMSSVN